MCSQHLISLIKLFIVANYKFRRFSKSRVENFSDGVFAIIVTLLVLEIKIPELQQSNNQLIINNLIAVLPKIFIWMNSFLIVCIIWMNHHRLMELLEDIDTGIFWFNNLLLMFASLVPFPTAVVGQYPSSEVALSFYGICMSFPAFGFFMWRLYIIKHPNLLKEGVNFAVFKKGTRLILHYGPGLYLVGAALSWVSTLLAFAIYFFIPLYFIFPKFTQTKD